jgi:hypothetical protein
MQCNHLDITHLNWNVPSKPKGVERPVYICNHVLYSQHENQPALASTNLVPPKTISRYIHMNHDIVRTHTLGLLVASIYSTPTKFPL